MIKVRQLLAPLLLALALGPTPLLAQPARGCKRRGTRDPGCG